VRDNIKESPKRILGLLEANDWRIALFISWISVSFFQRTFLGHLIFGGLPLMQAWQASCAATYAERATKQSGFSVAQAMTTAAPAATAAAH
jgi:hypothetical protein